MVLERLQALQELNTLAEFDKDVRAMLKPLDPVKGLHVNNVNSGTYYVLNRLSTTNMLNMLTTLANKDTNDKVKAAKQKFLGMCF